MTVVDDIDSIIHWIVNEEFSPQHICCFGYHVCHTDECKAPTTNQPLTTANDSVGAV